MFKKLILIMTTIAMVSTMAFAETSSTTKKKTVQKQAKHVSAKPAKKQQIASKNTKKTKKKSKLA